MRSPRSYQKEIARLYSLLDSVEWVQPMYNGSPSCSFCGEQRHFGHADGCSLAAALDKRFKRNAAPEDSNAQ